MTVDELVALCEGAVDVAVDMAARDLDRVLDRLRMLAPHARATLHSAVTLALARAREDLHAVELEAAARSEDIVRWQTLRASANTPALAAQAEAQIAALETRYDAELAEHRASVDQLARALALILRSRT